MGVFARFRRKGRDSEAASTAEGGTATLTAEPEPEAAAEVSAEDAPEPAGATAGTAPAAESVEIPKQQSAEHAADNEAGDDARK